MEKFRTECKTFFKTFQELCAFPDFCHFPTLESLSIKWEYFRYSIVTQRAFSCSKLTVETLMQGVKYVQSKQ